MPPRPSSVRPRWLVFFEVVSGAGRCGGAALTVVVRRRLSGLGRVVGRSGRGGGL